MAVWAKGVSRGLRRLAAAALGLALGLSGCKKEAPRVEAPPPNPSAAQSGAGTAPGSAGLSDDPSFRPGGPLHLPFAEATRQGDDPPAGESRPPDETATGKPVFKLYARVMELWDTIHFINRAGKRLDYAATVETDLGNVEIELLPDAAPNHVRNFIALARAGYYDGLRFDRIIEDRAEDGQTVLQEVQAGCPLGTGEPGFGSIGYWLKPEFSDKITHEAGTVGACRGEELDSAGCKFYITLGPVPFLDGNYTAFGKVTQGLDVVRKIFQSPCIDDGSDTASHQPEKPILIHKVTIHTREAEATH